jgi:putative membrane protein
MAQHLIIIDGVAPLVLLARPFDLYVRYAGKHATVSALRALRPLHGIALPPVALVFFIATLWGTHFSPLYELALEHQGVHVAEHFIYLTAGIVFWLPVIAPPPLRPPSFPVRLFYLAVALPQGALLGMVLAGAREPLYSHYVATAGSRAAALADQVNAGAVMWIAGGLVIFSALLATLGVWARREGDSPRISKAPAATR